MVTIHHGVNSNEPTLKNTENRVASHTGGSDVL